MRKIITVDGSSGVGKGTLALFLSNHLKWSILDSGAIYRLAALFVQNNKLDIQKADTINQIANLPIKFQVEGSGVQCVLSGVNVSSEIRTEECGMLASNIASIPEVRKALLDRQKIFDNGSGLIADGRDMGTVVFPNACLKFYLTASSESKAQRRYKELLSKGISISYPEVLNNIKQRDYQDMNRKISPLIPAPDAVAIDTSNMSITDVQRFAVTKIKKLALTS